MKETNLRQLWSKRLAEQKESGKSIVAWCQEQSITENQFYYWRKKLNPEQPQNDKSIKWLSLNSNIDNTAGVKQDPIDNTLLVHIGQATIEVKQGFNPQLFAQVLQVLKTIC